jgi:hypothetical protein
MTDRLKGCWVAFSEDIRVDDAEGLLNAIRYLHGVESVEGSVSTPDDWMARERVRHELIRQLRDVLK